MISILRTKKAAAVLFSQKNNHNNPPKRVFYSSDLSLNVVSLLNMNKLKGFPVIIYFSKRRETVGARRNTVVNVLSAAAPECLL